MSQAETRTLHCQKEPQERSLKMTRGLHPRPLLLLACPKPRLLKLCTSLSLTHKTEMFNSGMKQKHSSGSMRLNEIGDFIIPSSTPYMHQSDTHPLWQDLVSHLPPFNPARSTKKSKRNDPAAITEHCRSCCLPVLGDTAWWIFWPHPGHARGQALESAVVPWGWIRTLLQQTV